MALVSLVDRLSAEAEAVLHGLADPDDDVTFGVVLSATQIEHACEHTDEEPELVTVPAATVYVAVRCPEFGGELAGQADLPLFVLSGSGSFSFELQRLWEELSFRRIALAMPEVAMRGRAITGDDCGS